MSLLCEHPSTFNLSKGASVYLSLFSVLWNVSGQFSHPHLHDGRLSRLIWSVRFESETHGYWLTAGQQMDRQTTAVIHTQSLKERMRTRTWQRRCKEVIHLCLNLSGVGTWMVTWDWTEGIWMLAARFQTFDLQHLIFTSAVERRKIRGWLWLLDSRWSLLS